MLADRQAGRALATLSFLESVRPGVARTSFLQARAYRYQGQMARMRDALKEAFERGYPVEQLEREQHLAIAQLGRLQEALPHLPGMLDDPQDDASDICEAYINGYLLTYQFNPASALLEAWIADCPRDAQAWFVKGLIADEMTNFKEAAESMKKAVEIAPHRSDIRLRYARTLASLHEYEQASAEYSQLISQAGDDPETLTGWAECLVETARGDEARAVYRKILSLAPDHEPAATGLARLEFQQGNYEASLKILNRLFLVRPADSDIRYLLGQVLRRLGRDDEAREHLEYFEEAETAIRKATDLMLKVRDDSANPDLRYQVGSILVKYGHRSDGAGWLRSVLEFAPDHRPTHEALRDYYLEEGLSDLARQHEKALDDDRASDES